MDQYLFLIILTITLFSYWAAFALLIINRYFHQDIPGYRIGRLCIWEAVAMIIAAIIAKWMVRRWGNIRCEIIDGHRRLTLDHRFGIYFLVYFLVAIAIGVWQFWLFSQKF